MNIFESREAEKYLIVVFGMYCLCVAEKSLSFRLQGPHT